MTMNVAVSGVKAATADLNTIAHNIANVNTDGFKNSRAEFGDLVGGSGSSGLLGVRTQAVNQLFQQGSVRATSNDGGNNKMDLAIIGNGFFQVANVTGAAPGTSVGPPLYTRAGSFKVDAGGFVVNNLGQRLQLAGGTPPALGGDIVAPADPLTAGLFAKVTDIKPDGTLSFSDGTSAQAVGVYDFPNIQGLKAVGDTEWVETAASGPGVAITTSQVLGGYLEGSNSDLTDQLVNMIVAQRNFQANAKTITTENTLSETIINIR
jgi:flagellar hook protein FlgE